MIHVKTTRYSVHVTKTSETKDNIYFPSGEQHPENPNRRRQALLRNQGFAAAVAVAGAGSAAAAAANADSAAATASEASFLCS
jgi:hypothetical protein